MSQLTATQVFETTKAQTLNQFSLTGRLGADAEIFHFESGCVVKVTIAVNESKQEKASWYAATIWNPSEKQINRLVKGTKITLTGEMRLDTWTDKVTGEQRNKLKLHVNDRFAMEFHTLQTKSAPKPKPVTAPVASELVQAEVVSDQDWNEIAF